MHRRQRTLRSVRAEAVPEWQVATENVPSDQGSIVASPCRIFMGQGLANPWTADVTPALIRLYERWADGGTGTLITGVICVRRGAEDNVIVALDDRTDTDALRRWASAVHRRDVRLLGQIQHPCRQVPAYMARHPVAPSALPLAHGSRLFGSSRALTADEITDLVEKSANAAAMLEQAGFDGAELYAAPTATSSGSSCAPRPTSAPMTGVGTCGAGPGSSSESSEPCEGVSSLGSLSR